MSAKGIMSLRISSAPWEKGSKTGISRDTDSSEKAEMEATFPVLKNADWRMVRKKRDVRRSERVRERNGEDVRDGGIFEPPFNVQPCAEEEVGNGVEDM